MIYIRSNPDNDEYLEIKRIDIAILLIINSNIPKEIRTILSEIYSKLCEFESDRKNGIKCVSDISIKKNSELGIYLLNTKDIEVINKDKIIYYKYIVNAFNVAVFEDDPIQKEILPLFKKMVSGDYDELAINYNKDVLDYILANKDFSKHLNINDNVVEIKKYVVYENDEFSYKKLSKGVKTKKLSNKKK